MPKLIAIGETLIDFMPSQKGRLCEVESFTRCPGGAPANVAACAAQLGAHAMVSTMLGADPFGEYLFDCLGRAGIDMRGVMRTAQANTALAFVSHNEEGDRDFLFYRSPSADMLLSPEDIDPSWFSPGDILHFCSVALVDGPCRRAHDRAIELARANGCRISFDVNLRPPLWPDPDELRRVVLDYIPHADIVKAGEDELDFLGRVSAPVLIITRGKGAATWRSAHCDKTVSGFDTPAVDTTGAGDAFIGALLSQLLLGGLNPLTLGEVEAAPLLTYAHAVSSLVVSRRGGINAMPTPDRVADFLSAHS